MATCWVCEEQEAMDHPSEMCEECFAKELEDDGGVEYDPLDPFKPRIGE